MVEIKSTQTEYFSNPPKIKKTSKSKGEKFWFVYILECQDGSFYTGVTNNLNKRMEMHAKGKGSKYVQRRKFKCLLISKECESRSKAQKAECQIKKLQKYDKLDWFNDSKQQN